MINTFYSSINCIVFRVKSEKIRSHTTQSLYHARKPKSVRICDCKMKQSDNFSNDL